MSDSVVHNDAMSNELLQMMQLKEINLHFFFIQIKT